MKRVLITIVSVLYIVAVAACGIYAATHQTFSLDSSYYGASEQFNVDAAEYEQLIRDKASFVAFVDMYGCITADGLRDMLGQITADHSFKIVHIMWPEAKNTSLHGPVRYYPSIVIVHKGQIVDFLKADSKDDAQYYNSREDLTNWLMHYINL